MRCAARTKRGASRGGGGVAQVPPTSPVAMDETDPTFRDIRKTRPWKQTGIAPLRSGKRSGQGCLQGTTGRMAASPIKRRIQQGRSTRPLALPALAVDCTRGSRRWRIALVVLNDPHGDLPMLRIRSEEGGHDMSLRLGWSRKDNHPISMGSKACCSCRRHMRV